MSTGDGLHSRFHKHGESNEAPTRGAVLVATHQQPRKPRSASSALNADDSDDSLSRPLISNNNDDDEDDHSYNNSRAQSASSYARFSTSSGVVAVRRDPTTWDNARTAFVSFACSCMDLLPTRVSFKVIDEVKQTDIGRISDMKDALVHPFSKENPEHYQLVADLWNVCHVGHALFAPTFTVPPLPEDLKSEQWKVYGFQGVDPSTDFRGAGVFSLRNLLYLSEAYPSLFGKLVRAEYPFAIAGINVSMMLMTQLGLASIGQTCLATTQNTTSSAYSFAQARAKFVKLVASGNDLLAREKIFSEVYCLALALLHERWLASKRNIMEFNQLLKLLAKQVETILKCSTDLGSILGHGKLD